VIGSPPSGYGAGMRTLVLLSLLALVPACPMPEPQSDDEGTDTTDATDDTGSTDTTDTTDTDTTDSTTGEPDSQHGTVKFEIVAEDPANPPFAGTVTISASVLYEDCLRDFYVSEHPELQQGGLAGAEVFAEWTDRLCDPALENVVACEVTDIEQLLIPDNGVYQLRVTFAITDPASIEDSWLYIGPLPSAELVADVCDSPPQVEVRANSLHGRDAADAPLWDVKTLPATSSATTDQATPLRITVGN
jgi:hypothetical protein